MDILLHTAVIWFIIGFILFILEFVVPGLILFFFAVGAWTVAILSIFVVIPLTGQLLIFVITSVLTIFILRKWLQKRLYGDQTSTGENVEITGNDSILLIVKSTKSL